MNDSPGYITRMNTGREEILKHAVLTVSQALQRNCDVDFNSNLPKCKYQYFLWRNGNYFDHKKSKTKPKPKPKNLILASSDKIIM